MKNLLFVAIILLASTISLSVNAQSEALGENDLIPKDIVLMDQSNNKVQIDDLYGENGLVFVFYRSAKWCPYCQAQLINLKAYQDDIQSEGYNIAAISYDSIQDLKEFSDKRKITFPLLSDTKSEVIKLFGLLNTEYEKGSFAYGVPYPAIYVIKKDGKIKDMLREEGYKKRPEVSKILQIIKE